MNRAAAFRQMVLARMREFFREPIALFWVYGFPLILAFILYLAFSRSKVPPPTVDVAISPKAPQEQAAALRDRVVQTLQDDGIDVHLNDETVANTRLTQTRTSLVVVVVLEGDKDYVFRYDQVRPDCVNAKYRVEATLARSKYPDAVRIRPDVKREKGSEYIAFLLPGLIGINLLGGGLFGIGFNLVETRSRKLFKRLMATPIHRVDYLLAMLTTRMIFLVPEMIFMLCVARPIFDVPVKGSWLVLVLVIVAGAVTFAGFGLLIGCRTEKTETASGLLNLVMLPQYLFSGVFFSSRNFPDAMQPFVQSLPLTQLNNALRAVMLEGEGLTNATGGLSEVSVALLVMSAWGLGSFFLALRWFKWS